MFETVVLGPRWHRFPVPVPAQATSAALAL
jgi:hypothetical protein